MSEEKVVQNLRRIEGQVKGLQRMVTERRDCDDILMQIMAVKAALDRVTSDLVETNVERCFQDHSPDEVKAKMTKTLSLLCKM